MPRTRIKICGICRPEDALAAAHAGADAIGMVFHPSAKRNLSLDQAEEILAVLPPFVTPVGLFVDASTQSILDTADRLRLRHVQLHGHESPQQIAELRGLTILKAIRVLPHDFAETLTNWRNAIISHGLTHLQGLVLETANLNQPGGSGVENDWRTIRRHLDRGEFAGLPALIAAGGLTPENVAAVVRELHPWAVDVSSGVENVLRQKSSEKIVAFVQAVRGEGA